MLNVFLISMPFHINKTSVNTSVLHNPCLIGGLAVAVPQFNAGPVLAFMGGLSIGCVEQNITGKCFKVPLEFIWGRLKISILIKTI